MLLSKTNLQFFLAVFLIFSNFWIYKIYKENFYIGIALTIITVLLYFFQGTKNQIKISIFSLLILLFLQFQTTNIQNLTKLDDDQLRIRNERMQSYPPIYIDLKFKVIWLKPAHWIEENDIVTALSRIQNNFFETIDINRYFFGGYPRNKPSDFEKLPFVLLPLFLIGLYKFISSKNTMALILLSAPVLLTSIIGNDNPLGAFSLFPVLLITTSNGIKILGDYLINSKHLYLLFILITILGFILQISYAKI